jgi:hypothetical protein
MLAVLVAVALALAFIIKRGDADKEAVKTADNAAVEE